MKLQITTKQTKEVLIGIPSYTRVGCDYYAVLDTDKVLKIWHGQSTNATIISNSATPEDAYQDGFEQLERNQFFTEYQKIVDKVSADFDKAFEDTYTNDNPEREICEHSAKMEEEA